MRFFSIVLMIPVAVGAVMQPLRHNPASLPPIESNDNTREAGTRADGVLSVTLEAKTGELWPEGPRNPSLTVYAFGEEGRPLQAPGPQIRVRAGTPIRVTVRNSLPKRMMVRGLNARPGLDSIDLAPGEVKEVRFTPQKPGTFYYWGRTEGRRSGFGFWNDGQLAGALIVDSAGPRRPERVMVITNWGDLSDTARVQTSVQTHMFVNGLSWPYTERMNQSVGDSVFWRVINTTSAPHPMHLHGFYYSVLSKGTENSDTVYAPADRRTVVTESMASRSTMTMSWTPTRPGNWLFHCHLIAHISADSRLGDVATARAQFTHGMHSHAVEGMAGLVTGIHVSPGNDYHAAAPSRLPAQKLHVFANRRDFVFGGNPGYSFILQRGSRMPSRDSIRIPGSPIVLTRGVPYEIAVTNRTPEMVSIHWHGIELQSYFDGVGDWSGMGGQVAPPIMPGKTFVVKFTPDRAGTFIYHTHSNEDMELASGLYGPLLILEPGEKYDAESDRLILLAAGGPKEDATPLINGSARPAPMQFTTGHTYRIRLINISPSDGKLVRLLADTTVQQWRAFAKDGATLPQNQAVIRPAIVLLNPGETYDYEFSPAMPRTLSLEVVTSRRAVPPVKTLVMLKVK